MKDVKSYTDKELLDKRKRLFNKPDSCEWIYSNGFFKAGCCDNEIMQASKPAFNFIFCPWCGKPIKKED